MRRHSYLLLFAALLLVPLGAWAEPFGVGRALNQQLISEVMRAALTFAAPRVLTQAAMPDMTMWALDGLTVLDARLQPELSDGTLRLVVTGRVLFAQTSPTAEDASGWGEAAAHVVRAGWDASDIVRITDTEQIIRALLDAMCSHLDPYSRYVTPVDAESDRDRRSGIAGIGLRVARSDGSYAVVEVTVDGPAAAEGVRVGQRLLAIDGESTEGAEPSVISAAIAGPEGTSVVLTLDGHDGPPRDVELTRASVPPRTVRAEWRGNVLVLRVSGFADDTGERLAEEILDTASGPHRPLGLVIDLRGNRGGVLREAVAAAESILPDGVVATTNGRDPEAVRSFVARGADLSGGLPVVVMVDGDSASAAEILAAGLADQHRAVVVGSTTLGKGLVQTIAPLPDGGELLITWSRVLAPLGWPIQGLGVLPQVCTSLGAPALEHQIERLAHGEQVMALALRHHRNARAPLSPNETLLLRMACPAVPAPTRGWDMDLWAAQRLLHDRVAYAAALLGPPEGQVTREGVTPTAVNAPP